MKPFLALRLALAGLRRDPATSTAAVAILALGLAAPVTFFSMLWGGGFRPLPVPDGHRVMRVEALQARGGGSATPVSFRDTELLEGVPGVEAVGAFRTSELAIGTPELGTLPVSGAVTTPATFRLLRVDPALGRIPGGSEARTALVLSHDLWTRHFDADPGVLGRMVVVGDEPRTVVAVMPDGFRFPFRQAAWALTDPAAPVPATDVEPVLRVRDGVSAELLGERMTARWRGQDAARPPDDREAVLRVRPFTRGRGEAGEGWAFLGLVLVGLCLLIIACVNTANLLLVRALERIRTLGVQSALGASRSQLALQLFLEALLLAAAGGLLGLGLAHLLVTYVQEVMGPENFGYYWMRLAIDGPVILFAGALVMGTALAAGTLPVVRVLRVDLQQVLKAGGDTAFHGPFRGWSWGRVFVTGQLALSCFALVAAGLTAGAMRTAGRFGAGVPGEEILEAPYRMERTGALEGTARRVGFMDLELTLRSLPGVRRSALALGAPGYYEPWSGVELTGSANLELDAGERVFANAVTPGFFPALDLELLQGRLLREGDVGGAEPVAVVNASFLSELAPAADPLGLSVRVPVLDSIRSFRVVGVVSDPGLGAGPRVSEAAVYLPMAQVDAGAGRILIRGSVTPELSRAVRAAFSEDTPDLVVGEFRTLEDGYRFMTRAQSTLSLLAVAGGLAGLLVAGAGLYALLAFRVRRSRRELGVRLALGADGGRLAREVLGSALGQLLPGLAVGLVLAWMAAPLLGILLLGGDPRSPVAYALVAGVFLATGLIAALLPALRAADVQPARVLTTE